MDIVRRVFLRYALSRDPKVVEKGVGKLEGLLKEVGKGGENFHAYSEAIDAFRDAVYFVEKTLGESEANKLKGEAEILSAMSKNPFRPDEVLSAHGDNAFNKAVTEVKHVKTMVEKAEKAAQPAKK